MNGYRILFKSKLFDFGFIVKKRILSRSLGRNPVEYDVVKTDEKVRDKVLDFLKIHYFPDEPLAKCTGGVVGKMEKQEVLNQITNGLSLMAVERNTNKIIGVTLNEIYTKESTSNLEAKIKKCQLMNDPYWHVLELFRRLDTESNFWKKLGVSSCLRNAAICTDRSYRNMNIATNLLDAVKKVSNEKYLKGESTNDISYQILSRQGWKTLHEINLQDFRDETGKVIFNTKYPNTHIKLIVYEI